MSDKDFDILGLQRVLRNTPSETSSFLFKSMLESFREQICIQQCQFNRVVCILRPKCPQRHFQDLLLHAGYQHSDIPQFCYSVRLKEINESYNRELPFGNDITIYLDDFYRLFGQKKPRFHPNKEFGKILSFFQISNIENANDDFIVLGLKKNIIFVDLKQDLVTVNPISWLLEDSQLIESVLKVLATEYSIKAEITEKSEHFVSVTFSYPNAVESLNENKFDEILRGSDALMSYDADDKEVYGELQIPQREIRESQGLNIRMIRRIFDDLHDARPKQEDKSLSESSKQKVKA